MKTTTPACHPDPKKNKPSNPDESPPETNDGAAAPTTDSPAGPASRIKEKVHDLVEHFKEYASKVDL